MNHPSPSPADIEKYYACKTFNLTEAEYDKLLERGIRYAAHGLFNRNTWARQIKVHGGFAWSPCSQEFVDTALMVIRSEAK